MSASGLQATNQQNAKELDSMKESISDIINQLQDIDPARLSFSPFLDLDTQISLAPVSDSPESSVEELRSSSHSVSGSQRSLEPALASDPPKSSAPCHQRPGDAIPKQRQSEPEKACPDHAPSIPAVTAQSLDAATENCISTQTPASQGDIPNGTDTRWSPESTNLDCSGDEGRPLIAPPPESVELAVWSSEGQEETCEAAEEVSNRGRCCCRNRCCRSGRVPAFLSVLASLVFAVGIVYALFFHGPFPSLIIQNESSRFVFTLCCCGIAALPILLAMMVGATCQFCSGSFDLHESFPRRRAVQQLFVTASLEQLVLYVLNLVILASLVPQNLLNLVPIAVVMFILGRMIYWVSLNLCSSWRGFGAGLTFFPLLALVGLNLFLMFDLVVIPWLAGS